LYAFAFAYSAAKTS